MFAEAVTIHFRPKRCKRICCDYKTSGKQFKQAMTGAQSINICLPFSNSFRGGRRRAGRSTELIGRCSCEGILRLGSRNRLPL